MTTTAQTWTLLGILGVFATMSLTLVLFSYQSLRGFMEAKFEGVDAKLEGLNSKFEARFDAVDIRFDAVDRRFDGVDRRLDALDLDVQALTDRVFRDRP